MIKEFEHVALLIDADNAQAAKTESILKDVSTYGRIVIKRAYGNWAKPNLAPWEKENPELWPKLPLFPAPLVDSRPALLPRLAGRSPDGCMKKRRP